MILAELRRDLLDFITAHDGITLNKIWFVDFERQYGWRLNGEELTELVCAGELQMDSEGHIHATPPAPKVPTWFPTEDWNEGDLPAEFKKKKLAKPSTKVVKK